MRIQRSFKNQCDIYSDAENFILISKYTCYMVSIWCTSDLHVVTSDNKSFITPRYLGLKPGVEEICVKCCNQTVTACFTLAPDANRSPAKYLLKTPQKIGTAGRVVHNVRDQSQVRWAVATGSQAICYRRLREINCQILATGT